LDQSGREKRGRKEIAKRAKKKCRPKPRYLAFDPNIALPKAGSGISKTLQLRIFRKLGVIEDFTLGEVLVSSGNGCSQLPNVPLQRFRKISAALCGSFPAEPPSSSARLSQRIICYWRVNFYPVRNNAPLEFLRGFTTPRIFYG
jgi:hypothetical protein